MASEWRAVSTDYLVVGAGASGLAFADALAAEADVDVTVLERREAPGGHWLQVYPFVRLHTPSAYYGVSSLSLGENRVDEDGENAGSTRGRLARRFASTSRRQPLAWPRPAESACSRDTSTWAGEATASGCTT